MRRDDYIRVITSGLLTVPDDGFAGAIAHVGRRFELYERRKPEIVSLAGQHASGEEIDIVGWLEGLRREQILRVSFSWGNAGSTLPPAIAAAFAGGLIQYMHVSTSIARRSYVLQAVRCPQYQLTPQQFGALIDNQESAVLLWQRIEELVEEGNTLNNRRPFPLGTVAAYLCGANGFPEGRDVYEFMASDLFREAQIECAVAETPFVLPEVIKPMVYQSSFSFGDNDSDHAFLYPLQDVTASDLYALLLAQPFEAEVIWHRTAVILQDYPPDGIPEPMVMRWELALHTLDADSFSRVVGAVCQAICQLCDEERKQPEIPDALAKHFGPNALDAQRARMRGKIEAHQWYLQGTVKPWELYIFAFAGEVLEQEPSELPSWREPFQRALVNAHQFALQINSPFAEAFRLGGFVLSDEFLSGNSMFNEPHEKQVRYTLAGLGFSENAQEIFMRSFWLGEEMSVLQWSVDRIRGLIALDITDVFGGMGSWNDIGQEDDNEYQRITDELFRCREHFFCEVLDG